MRALLGPIGILLIWIILTASAGVATQMHDVAKELRKPDTSNSIVKPINSVFDQINSFAAGTTNNFFKSVKFDPGNKVIILPNITTIETRHIMLLIGLIVLIPAIYIYRRAIRSDSPIDDFVALLVVYVLLVVMLSITLGLGFKVEAVLQRGWVLAIFSAVVLILSIQAGALDDSRLFFRGLFQILVLALFLFPLATIVFVADTFDKLADFGTYLRTNGSVFLFWSVVGLALALGELYKVGTRKKGPPPAKPAGRRDADKKTAAGGAPQ